MELEKFYGYSSVKIKGLALNLNTDFKVLSTLFQIRDDINENKVRISIIDFAEMMGNNRRAISNSTKKAIDESLDRLMSQTISFITKKNINDVKSIQKANLINNADIYFDEGYMDITFNEKIKEIYNNDKYVQYVNLETFMSIKGETAKALWLFYEANSKFTSFKKENIEKRLLLKEKELKEINRQLKNSHEELINMGYLLKYEFEKGSNTFKIQRHKNKQK